MKNHRSRCFPLVILGLLLVWAVASSLGEEPNDDFASSNRIPCLYLQWEYVGDPDVDYYRIEGQPLAEVSIDIDAAEGGSGLDSLLGVFNSSQMLLDWSDDDAGPSEPPSTDSFLTAVVPSDGILYIAVTRAGDMDFDGVGGSNADGYYFLNVVCSGIEDPHEPNSVFADATPLACPVSIHTALSIDPLGDRDFFVVHALPGTLAKIDLDGHDLGSQVDLTLGAYEEVGPGNYRQIAFSDDEPPEAPVSLDPHLEVSFPAGGDLYLAVQTYDGLDPDEFGDTAGVYNLSVRCVPPPGALLGTTAAARALIDIDAATGESLLRADHSGIVTDLEFLQDFFSPGKLLGPVGLENRIMAIDRVTGVETLYCDHEPGLLGALEQVGSTLYGSFSMTINDVSFLAVVERPVASVCTLTQLALTGYGALGGLAYDTSQDVLYGCVGAGTGAGEFIECDPSDTPACRSVGPTGFDSCGALAFGPDGVLYGGVSGLGGGSPDGGKLFTVNPATGRGTEVGPTGYASLSGLAFVPSEGDWTEPNDFWLEATPVPCDAVLDMSIEPLNDVDFYHLTATTGTWVLADVDALEQGSSLDTIIGEFGLNGALYNWSAISMTPGELWTEDASLWIRVPNGGELLIGVASENDIDFLGMGGLTIGAYDLTLHCVGAAPCLPPTGISGPGSPLLQVQHGTEYQDAKLVFPNPGRGYETKILGVDILRNGLSLNTAPGATPAENLLNRLTYLGTVEEDVLEPVLFYVDAIYSLDPGEMVGYLLVSKSKCNGTYGSLGELRGSVDVSELSYPTGSSRIHCTCGDATILDICVDTVCSDTAREVICTDQCRAHGGHSNSGCIWNHPFCPY